jgi:gliding motility-associatede transport system auxiliary component
MNQALRRKLALAAFLLAGAALVFSGGWGIVNRQFDVAVQIALAVMALFIGLGVLLDPTRVRAALTGRQARYGSNAVLVSLAFTGILVVVTFLAITNTRQLDLTEDREYTLTTESQLVLAELQQPVRLLGFFTPAASASREYVRPLLDQYKRSGDGKVSYEFIDPRADPVSADRYGVNRDATVVIVFGDYWEVAPSATEQQITGAIVRLANPEERKVYFLTGHGEHEMDSTAADGYSDARDALQSKAYDVAGLSLVGGAVVPEDARAVVIAGPTIDLLADETRALGDYVAQGGSLVVLLEPPVATDVTADDALVAYLASDWGIEARPDLAVDLRSMESLTAVADQYASHPITERLSNLVSYFPSARSLAMIDPGPSELRVTELVLTGSDSWGKVDQEAILAGSLDYVEAEDTPGPLTVAMTVENDTTGARLVVVGDSHFAANSDYSTYANGDLLINSIDWAAHLDELISLTPKQATSRYVVPPTAQAVGLIFLLTVLVIPGAVVAAGASVWWRRRKQR